MATINEGLIWLKTLRAQHAELTALRNENAVRETRRYGIAADKDVTRDPVYDVKALDKLVTQVASEIRRCEMAIKQANATTAIAYEIDEGKLGAIE